MWNNRHANIIIVLLLVLTSGCTFFKKKQAEELKPPYQQALEKYWEALDTNDFKSTLTVIDNILGKHPADLETRTLRAQVYLKQFLSNPGSGTGSTLLEELQVLSERANSVSTNPNWIQPRLYTTMGDYLLLLGKNKLKHVENNPGEKDLILIIEAKTYFEAARAYYANAYSLANTITKDWSEGLILEAGNLKEGYVESQKGIISSLDFFDPKAESKMAQTTRRAILQSLDVFFHEGKVSSTTRQSSFDPSYHENARIIYKFLVTIYRNDVMSIWCNKYEELKAELRNKKSILNTQKSKIVGSGLSKENLAKLKQEVKKLEQELKVLEKKEKEVLKEGRVKLSNYIRSCELKALHILIKEILTTQSAASLLRTVFLEIEKAYKTELEDFCEAR